MSLFSNLMRDFGQIIGLEGLVPNDDNECVLEIDNFIVTLSGQGDDFLLIYSTVGTLPEKNREDLYARLLSGNYFFAETGGATLAVNPDGGDIQFLYGVNVKGMDAGALSRIMENYLDRLEHWSGVCKDGAKGRAAEDQPSSLRPFEGIRG